MQPLWKSPLLSLEQSLRREFYWSHFTWALEPHWKLDGVAKGQLVGTSICAHINADLVGITCTLQRSQLWSPQGVVWLHVILHIWQLNQRSKCQIRRSGTLCGFVTLPRGRWIHKAMNGLQWGINIAFSSDIQSRSFISHIVMWRKSIPSLLGLFSEITFSF